MALTFAQKLLIEQIRAMEEASTLSTPAIAPANDGPGDTKHGNVRHDIEQALLQRAQSLCKQHNLLAVLTRAARISRRIGLGLMALAATGGVFAVLQALTSAGPTLNIYWLIIVLLGANTIALMLWLIAVLSLNPNTANHSALGTLWHWIEPRIASSNPRQAAADQSWLLTAHHGQAGRWWLSAVSHSMWLCYLLGALVILVLLLMTKQFDFVWATTILSDDVFISLTQSMATPLNKLGLPSPTLEQITISRYGADHQNAVELRRTWAMFLLGSIGLYGVLPRMLLLGFCALMRRWAHSQFQLDDTRAYYIKLKQQLMPMSVTGDIVDPDREPRPASLKCAIEAASSEAVPDNARWVALELGRSTHWPVATATHNLGHITDAAAMALIMKSLSGSREPLAVAVSIERLPDRGIKRLLMQLYNTATPSARWLVIIDNNQLSNTLTAQRLASWRNMAHQCNLPSGHISVLRDAQQ